MRLQEATQRFREQLRNRGKFFDHEEKRERDLILIDYDDPALKVFESELPMSKAGKVC